MRFKPSIGLKYNVAEHCYTDSNELDIYSISGALTLSITPCYQISERLIMSTSMRYAIKTGLSFSRAQSRFLQASSWRRYSFGSQRTFATSGMRPAINKICASAAEAIADMKSNSTVLVGGFGLCGVPSK